MKEWSVEVSRDLVSDLERSIQQGPVLNIVEGKPRRFLTEETVARVNGLKVQVFSNEHPPPHFRVQYQNSTANYRIADCSRLNGSGDVLKYEKNVQLWWEEHKNNLIETWDRLRPADCPVGKYTE